MMKRVGVTLAALLMAVSVAFGAAACGGRQGEYDEEVDTDRVQLYVSNYDGGFGTDWLRDIKAAFEAEYADVSFDGGKTTGIQIMIDPNKEKGYQLNFNTTSNEIFFTEEVRYYQNVMNGDFLDITDVVEEVCEQEGVSLRAAQEQGLQYNGKYYALPHYETFFGIVYDKDLFDTKRLYIAEDGSYTNASGNLSAGPDGVKPSYDDGLPATMEEFFELCNYMKTVAGVKPFILTGEHAAKYSANFVNRAAAAYDGKAVTEARYSFAAKDVAYITENSIKADNSVLGYSYQTQTADITNANGYLLQRTPGRLYGLAFLEKLIDEDCFEKESLRGTTSHLNAQENYINSGFKNAPVAMLMDGNWWENEATLNDAFTRSEQLYLEQAKKENRHFGVMPIPAKIDKNDANPNGDSDTALDMYTSYAFIAANIPSEKVNAAKTFLKFCYSAENLEKFTATTGVARALNYNVSQTTLDNMTSYSQDVWDMHLSGNTVLQVSQNKLYYENMSDFDSLALIAYGNYAYPWTALRDDAHTAAEYFTGTWQWTEDGWKNDYGAYIA